MSQDDCNLLLIIPPHLSIILIENYFVMHLFGTVLHSDTAKRF